MRLVLIAIIVAWGMIATAHADEAEYGPDWPVCRNLAEDPGVQIAACNRMIASGKLSQQHLAWAYNNRGTAWRDLGRIDLAEQDYIKSGQIWPTNWQANFNLGRVYLDTGRFNDALAQFDRVVEIAPDARGAQCQRGIALEKLYRFDDAKETFEQAIQAFPADACSISNLVEIYDARGRLDDIFPMIDRAMTATGGGTAELYGLRADIYRLRKRMLEPALADLNKAVELAPGFYDTIRDRGVVLTELGRYSEALQDLDLAVAIAPNFADSRFWRANAEIRSGAYRPALTDCEYALTLSPEDSRCQVLALRAAFLIGDFAAAARYADALPMDFFPSAPFFKAVALVGAGKRDAAAAVLQSYAAAEPNDPYGWLWLYLVDRQLGKEGPAEIKALAARRDAWPTPIFRFIAGAASADDVLAAAAVPDTMISRMRTGEANYYLGALAAIGGDASKSDTYMKASLAAGYAEIDPLGFIPVYKDSNAVELGLAAFPSGGSL